MRYRFLPVIAGLFTAVLLISNTVGPKIFELGGLTLSAGIIMFPLSYVFGDILTEVYGYSASRRIIWTGIAALVLMAVSYEIARALPPAAFWTSQAAFDVSFSQVPRLVVASIIAYFLGEFCNSYILARMKVATNGGAMGWRFILSTVAGEGVDTGTVVILGFAGVLPNDALLGVFFSAWVFKVAWEILALPLTLPFVRWLKRVENEDYFDRATNFNPFRLGQ
jgi:queuosine precursor transporter